MNDRERGESGEQSGAPASTIPNATARSRRVSRMAPRTDPDARGGACFQIARNVIRKCRNRTEAVNNRPPRLMARARPEPSCNRMNKYSMLARSSSPKFVSTVSEHPALEFRGAVGEAQEPAERCEQQQNQRHERDEGVVDHRAREVTGVVAFVFLPCGAQQRRQRRALRGALVRSLSVLKIIVKRQVTAASRFASTPRIDRSSRACFVLATTLAFARAAAFCARSDADRARSLTCVAVRAHHAPR